MDLPQITLMGNPLMHYNSVNAALPVHALELPAQMAISYALLTTAHLCSSAKVGVGRDNCGHYKVGNEPGRDHLGNRQDESWQWCLPRWCNMWYEVNYPLTPFCAIATF